MRAHYGSPAYNPFCADWFSIGTVLKDLRNRILRDTSPKAKAVEAVATKLCAPNPKDRPSPAEALRQIAADTMPSSSRSDVSSAGEGSPGKANNA